ncbi:tyrosine-type recombinase/integrase [Limnoglobus roseus]|uniref:Site-specific integrase n=1 Tax=Limnoglobus roseus TaxID=2598579 RepID=A0A5C1ALC9_9BACT|nr:site-specific integrase [Limnoglobus roseus]QEL18542.1 site-specific integrase [Limnoglobus roseus]
MLTLNHLIDSFQANIQVLVSADQREPNTWKYYYWQLKKLRPLGHLPAETIRTHHLVAIKFTNAFVRSLKALYKWGLEEELVPKDPFKKLTVPKCGQRTRILQRSEMVALYLASPRPFRLFLYLMRFTIARPGELRKLRWSQVDLPGGVLRLKDFKGKKRRRDGLKERTIAIGPRAVRMLEAWIRHRNPKPTDPVFPASKGGERSANALRCMMRAARTKAGLDATGEEERIVVYTMRHTGATEAIRNGVPLPVLSKMLGHTKTDMTNRYIHMGEQDMKEGIAQATKRRKKTDDS